MVTGYDPKKVGVNVDGTALTGFTSDGTITMSKSEDAAAPNVGVRDDVVYEENASESRAVAITLQQTFSLLRKLRNPASNRKRFALAISDTSDDTPANVSGSECRILREPDVARGKNTSTVTVNIYVPNLRIRQ